MYKCIKHMECTQGIKHMKDVKIGIKYGMHGMYSTYQTYEMFKIYEKHETYETPTHQDTHQLLTTPHRG